LRVLRKPSSEPGSPESEHRIGTSHDNGIKLELSIRASATHVEERTARMTDLEHIRAKFAAEYGLSEDMLRNAERWTETTGDLEGVPENLLPGILGMRFGAIAIDTPRSERWSTPEDIDVIADLAYLPDGGYDTAAGACRGHLLDLYLPHDAVLRGGHTLPVYIDIHGGGFTYGYKELNRNFNVHLAEQGFAVFSLNYRPAPQTDLRGQLADIQAALRWIAAHMADYPVNPNAVFLTGDSAGGALTLLTLAIENNAEAAAAFGVDKPSGIRFAGAAPVCGAYSSASLETMGRKLTVGYDPNRRIGLEQMLGVDFFAGLEAADPKFLTAEGLAFNIDLPPLLIITCGDDFLEADNLALAAALSRKGADFELFDPKPRRHETLGHVFVIGMPWLEESRECLDRIRRFSYERC
jgi:acetyl esterase/lipase